VKDPLVKGHPLHALLTDLPIGGLTLGLAGELAGLIRPEPVWPAIGALALGFALATGVLAALVGLWDYQAVPREHPARRVGAWHGWLNAAALVLLAGGLLARYAAAPAPLVAGLAALAFGLVGAAGWLGGDLVYRLGWRVRPAEELEQLDSGRSRKEALAIIDAHEREDTFLS